MAKQTFGTRPHLTLKEIHFPSDPDFTWSSAQSQIWDCVLRNSAGAAFSETNSTKPSPWKLELETSRRRWYLAWLFSSLSDCPPHIPLPTSSVEASAGPLPGLLRNKSLPQAEELSLVSVTLPKSSLPDSSRIILSADLGPQSCPGTRRSQTTTEKEMPQQLTAGLHLTRSLRA